MRRLVRSMHRSAWSFCCSIFDRAWLYRRSAAWRSLRPPPPPPPPLPLSAAPPLRSALLGLMTGAVWMRLSCFTLLSHRPASHASTQDDDEVNAT